MAVPTYEEYQKATAFAKFRYRFGFIVLILCWLALLYVIYFMVTNVNELGANPLQYACEKMHIECHCYRQGSSIDFYINATSQWALRHEYGSEFFIPSNFSETNFSEPDIP